MERKGWVKFSWVLLLGVFLLTIFHGHAQSAPLAALTESTFNFGSAVEGAKIEHDFILKNNGTEPLVIKKVVPG